MLFIRHFLFVFLLIFSVVYAEDTELQPNETIMIPMRDGKELPTDIYFPKNSSSQTPCILLRSPGGRLAKSAKAYIFLTQFGYTVVIQDTRSALDKSGKTLPYWNDGWGTHQDGYDSVQWLANSKYSNGNIGTIGISALGITQLLLAPTAPPALKCQYIAMATGNLYHDAIFPGGQLLKNQVEGWLGLYARDPSVKEYVCSQPDYNPFWNKFNSHTVAHQVKVPAIHYGGWYDTFVQGTIDAFISRQYYGGDGAKGKQKLVIGPWTHFWPASTKLGDFDVPKTGYAPPIDISAQRWFDYYLRGINNGVQSVPSVIYYVMGPFDGSPSSGNVWKEANQWPVPAVETPFYLSDDHHLSLSDTNEEKEIAFHYDPKDPVNTIGGRNLFLESGPKDQSTLEKRKDVIVFTTKPLEENLEITGRIKAKLKLHSDQKDTDIVVRLTDVYPDGRSILIADGILRTGTLDCSIFDCQKPHEFEVDLWSTSIVFAKGHSIRVSVTGSNYPRHEKNCHADHLPHANNKLFIGGKHSFILLPVVEKKSS